MDNEAKILIATSDFEDRSHILAALSNQDDLKIIGIENDETDTVIKSVRFKPDVLILDLHSPEIDASDLAQIIHRRSPATGIILLCDRDENDYAIKAFRAGITGYLLRKADMNNLLHAVKIVNLGGYFISNSINVETLDIITLIKYGCLTMEKVNCISFSSTELRIVEYIAEGVSDDEIAVLLNLNAGTIRNCMNTMKRKTRLKSRTQVVLFLLVCGLINIDRLNYLQELF